MARRSFFPLLLLAIGAASALPVSVRERVPLVIESVEGGPAFDVNHSYEVAEFAFAAYCSEKSLASWSCQLCKHYPTFTHVATVTDLLTSTLAFVGFDNTTNTITVSFRGSVNIPNWLTNFQLIKMRDWIDAPDAKIHEGFYRAYMTVREKIAKVLRDDIWKSACPACTRVVVTGHSLGASLAGICAMDLRVLFGKTMPSLYIELTSFGMPRTGNAALYTDYPRFVNLTHRVVHQNDIVPHLPPKEIGYHHVATEVWAKGEGNLGQLKFVVCNGGGEDASCSDSVPPKDYSVDDHMRYMGMPSDHC